MNTILDEVEKLREKHKDTNKQVKRLISNLTMELEDLESKLETIESGMEVINPI